MIRDLRLNDYDEFSSSFGGEFYLEDELIDEYGIQLGDISIHNINSALLSQLACQVVNHLRLNGHDFEFVPDPDCQDQPIRFAIKK